MGQSMFLYLLSVGLWHSFCPACVQADEKFKKDRFVLSVAFSPNGQRLACGSQDGTVAIFDVPTGKFMHSLEGHFKPVRSLTFTPGTIAASVHALLHSCLQNHI